MVDWQALIPTYYTTVATTASGIDTIKTVFTTNSGILGAENIKVSAYLDNALDSVEDTKIEVPITGHVSQFYVDLEDDLHVGQNIDSSKDVVTSFIHIGKVDGTNDVENEFLTVGTNNTLSDVYVELKLYKSAARSSFDTYVDVTISDEKRFVFKADTFCAKLSEYLYISTDVETIKGIVSGVFADIMASLSATLSVNTDIFNTRYSINYIGAEAEIISGDIQAINSDMFSTRVGKDYLDLDIRTWSLFTGDFFIDKWTYTKASSSAWVDVVDYLWPIDTSNTYFMVNDVVVSGTTFSGIDRGYRCYFNPSDDFYSDEPFTYTIHAQNSVGDVLEQDYYLLYGYDVWFDKIIDWGPKTKVDILTKAENKTYCLNAAAESFYFVTKDYDAYNLGSTIKPTAPVDLGSTINTQGRFFYYGGTYKVTVSGIRDYSGNELDPIEYSFTIENPLV